MKRKNVKNVKIAACAMAAAITFTGMSLDVSATGNIGSVLPSAGIDFSLQDSDKSTSLSNLKEEAEREAAKNEVTDDTAVAEGTSIGSVQVGGFADLASAGGGISTASSKKIEDTIVVSEGYTKIGRAHV